MKKRGQAAMEFLMTYGWAILVVLVVIGALAYFDVLSPGRMLPKKCQFATGIVCRDHTVPNAGSIVMRLNNGMGSDIDVTGLTFVADNSLDSCTGDIADQTLMTGEEADFTLVTCTIASDTGTRIKGDITLLYTNLQTGMAHTVQGTLVTDVE